MKKLLFSFAALAAFAACTEEAHVEPLPNPSETFTEVSFVANSQTKTHLDGEYNVIWDANDAVALKFTSSSQMKIVNFTTAEGGESATFKANLADDVTTTVGYDDNVFAVYPASAVDAESGKISSVLSTTVNGTIPSGTNLTSAVLSLDDLRAGTATAEFLNAYAIIEFTLPENVKSVKISGTAPLAGVAIMKFADPSQRLVVDEWNGASTFVTLQRGTGAALQKDKVYNILVYPGTHSSMTVDLTDTDGCVYSKTVSSEYKFEAAKYYTFKFNAAFTKEFMFTVSGGDVEDNSKIMAVFPDGDETHAQEAVVNSGSFKVQLPHSVNATSGYAVYPSSAYNDGKMAFNLDMLDGGKTYFSWGTISTENTSVALTPVKGSSFAKVTYTIPTGVASYTLTSTQALCGDAEATVTGGKLSVAPATSAMYGFTGNRSGSATLYFFPQNAATITVILRDANGASVTHTETVTVANGGTVSLNIPQSVDFSKSGSFTTEDFENGGKYDF